MLDGMARRWIDPAMTRAGRALASAGVTADGMTLAAFAVGLAAAAAIAAGWFLTGLFLIVVSRIGDGLDGAVARATRATDFGGYLDIVLDFAFYAAIPLGFVIADPAANAVAGAVLLCAFYVNGASFLAYAVMAERRGMSTERRGAKSLYFTTGLAEASETYIAFALACLLPGHFALIACVFAAICLYTTLARIVLAASVFGPNVLSASASRE